MSPEQMRSVVELYRRRFELQGIQPCEFASHVMVRSPEAALGHARWMLDRIDLLVERGETGKANRWLGFVQGCLWMQGFYSIDSLKAHNRPPE